MEFLGFTALELSVFEGRTFCDLYASWPVKLTDYEKHGLLCACLHANNEHGIKMFLNKEEGIDVNAESEGPNGAMAPLFMHALPRGDAVRAIATHPLFNHSSGETTLLEICVDVLANNWGDQTMQQFAIEYSRNPYAVLKTMRWRTAVLYSPVMEQRMFNEVCVVLLISKKLPVDLCRVLHCMICG